MNAKKALRKTLLAQRNRLFQESHSFLEAQENIKTHLTSFIADQGFEHIALYAAIGSEINILSVVDSSLSFYLPRVVEKELEFAPFDTESALEVGAFGILEPRSDRVDIERLDLVVLPGLAFGLKGERLGYGGGYYDRFLSQHACFSVGICDHRFLLKVLPTEDHDEKMDRIVSDRGVISC